MAIRFRQARDVRAWAAAGLGQLEAREALPLLLRSAEDGDDFFLRFTSMDALVAWKSREALPVFLRRVGDPFARRPGPGGHRSGDGPVTEASSTR